MAATAPRGQQGRQYQQDELEGRLRDALDELMADGTPFRDLSVARIIEAAGVARSTFYTYFEDKNGMLLALGERALERMYFSARGWERLGALATREDIAVSMRGLIDVFLADETVMRAVTETATYDSRIRGAYEKRVSQWAHYIARIIRQGRDSGRVRDGDPEDLARALAWMAERIISLQVPGASEERLGTIADTLAEIFSYTLFRDPS